MSHRSVRTWNCLFTFLGLHSRAVVTQVSVYGRVIQTSKGVEFRFTNSQDCMSLHWNVVSNGLQQGGHCVTRTTSMSNHSRNDLIEHPTRAEIAHITNWITLHWRLRTIERRPRELATLESTMIEVTKEQLGNALISRKEAQQCILDKNLRQQFTMAMLKWQSQQQLEDSYFVEFLQSKFLWPKLIVPIHTRRRSVGSLGCRLSR